MPIAILGAYQAMPKGRFWPKAGRPTVTLRYGAPLYPIEGETHQDLSRRMAQAVAQLFDEDRSTWWDSLQRAQRERDAVARRSAGSRVAEAVGGFEAARPAGARPGPGSRPVPRTGGEKRKGTLIEEAIRQFGREGYNGASLDHIATAVGVRKQTLLYYFPTKEALLEACLAAAGERLVIEIAQALEGKETYWDRAEAVIHAVFGLAEEWPEFPMFIREAGRLGPDAFARFAGVLDPLRRRAIDFLQTGMDTGEIRKQDPAMLLFTLYTGVVGSLTEASVLNVVVGADKGRASLKRREREVISFVRAAMLPPPSD